MTVLSISLYLLIGTFIHLLLLKALDYLLNDYNDSLEQLDRLKRDPNVTHQELKLISRNIRELDKENEKYLEFNQLIGNLTTESRNQLFSFITLFWLPIILYIATKAVKGERFL